MKSTSILLLLGAFFFLALVIQDSEGFWQAWPSPTKGRREEQNGLFRKVIIRALMLNTTAVTLSLSLFFQFICDNNDKTPSMGLIY